MPIPVPRLDDRRFDDLVAELLARIPGHTPEWTHPQVGDPGRTIIDLLAWLGDTLLYRANLIPTRQRLAFLRLLDVPLRPAQPATGLITIDLNDAKNPRAVQLPATTAVSGPLPFETDSELTVLPVAGLCYLKRRPSAAERDALRAVIDGLSVVYDQRLASGAALDTYITTPVFAAPEPGAGLDVVAASIDRSLWLALVAADKADPVAVKAALGHGSNGARALNLGLAPSIDLPAQFAAWGPAPKPAQLTWAITTGRWADADTPEFLPLTVAMDTTNGCTRRGVVRLVLPDTGAIGVPADTTDRALLDAGVGARPPRLEDDALAARIVAWIRLTPGSSVSGLPLTWAGINAVEVTQLVTTRGVVVASGSGQADLEVALPARPVDAATFAFSVEEPGVGFVPWLLIDDLGAAGRDDRVARLDPEAGTLRFGDGVHGRLAPSGGRILVRLLRAGGGAGGNLAPGALKAVSGQTAPLVVKQALATSGGQAGETLDEAERRIPAYLAHGDRAVTGDDFRRLARDTPATDLGRVEVLPLFKPQQRLSPVAGVVSVLVLPTKAQREAPNPQPDRLTLERVHAFLDARRPLASELYVIGTEYVRIGLSVAVRIADGHTRDAVLAAVQRAARDYLWPLAPGGRDGSGWALGATVEELELVVVVARVPGVTTVGGVRVFRRRDDGWRLGEKDSRGHTRQVLESWQLPEVVGVVVEDGDVPTEDPAALARLGLPPGGSGVAIPVVPETC